MNISQHRRWMMKWITDSTVYISKKDIRKNEVEPHPTWTQERNIDSIVTPILLISGTTKAFPMVKYL